MQAVRGIVVIATVLAAVACGGGVEPAVEAVESTTKTVPLDVTAPTNGWVQVGVETFDLVFT
jgi:ABC-type glycerol-3-phosphate transport system substrate-binding protein